MRRMITAILGFTALAWLASVHADVTVLAVRLGAKDVVAPLNEPVRCGGVHVGAGDIVVADEDGIVVVPSARRDQVLSDSRARLAKEAGESLDDWEQAHRARIDGILGERGFTD